MTQTGSFTLERPRRGVLPALALSMLLASLGASVANIALPALADAFAAPLGHVRWVVIGYLAGLTVTTAVAGRLGDRLGLRRMYLAGLALFAGASLLCALAPSLPLLVAARIVQGAGAAFLITLSMALARETAGEARVGRAMGLLGTVSALGTALGPSLGGLLLAAVGWRAIFVVQAPLALLALVLAWVSLPPDASRAEPVAGAPLRVSALLPNLIVNLLVAAVMMTTLVIGPFYLGRGLGLAEPVVGLVMSVGPLVSILSGLPSGRAVDAVGAPRVLVAGLALLAAGAFLLAVLPGLLGVTGYLLAIAVLTPGYQLFQAANNTAALAEVRREQRGAAAGLLTLSRNLGLIIGASAMSSVFALGVGTADVLRASPAAIASGQRTTFAVAGGLMLVALALGRGRGSRPGQA